MTHATKATLGAGLLASPSVFFVLLGAFERTSQERWVWFVFAVVTLGMSGISLFQSRIAGTAAISYALVLAGIVFLIGTAHPTLASLLVSVALDLMLISAAMLIGKLRL